MGIESSVCGCGVTTYAVMYDGTKQHCHVLGDYGKYRYIPHTCKIPERLIIPTEYRARK